MTVVRVVNKVLLPDSVVATVAVTVAVDVKVVL